LDTHTIIDALAAVRRAILANEAQIESLDRAIGDGDHFVNVRRGCELLVAMSPELQGMPPGPALHRIGIKLLGSIGGASGPLIASFFIAIGEKLPRGQAHDRRAFAAAFASGVEAIKRRGKADVDTELAELCTQLKQEATRNMLATKDMIASKGRASFLGERALGHIDPGCKSCEVAIAAVCDALLSPRKETA